jgi:hypothetical protein
VRPADQPVAVPTVIAAIALSWLGLVVHNLAELTDQARLGPATLAPTAVYLLLTAGWLSRLRRVAAWLLLGWGWLHAVGGGLLSVLPLPLWPYQPRAVATPLRHPRPLRGAAGAPAGHGHPAPPPPAARR